MVELRDLNEVEQKSIMNKYVSGVTEPTYNNVPVIIPDEIMVAYRCFACKNMKYVRVHKNDVSHVAPKVKCNCEKTAVMRLKHFGAGNIALLTSIEVHKEVFTLEDFF